MPSVNHLGTCNVSLFAVCSFWKKCFTEHKSWLNHIHRKKCFNFFRNIFCGVIICKILFILFYCQNHSFLNNILCMCQSNALRPGSIADFFKYMCWMDMFVDVFWSKFDAGSLGCNWHFEMVFCRQEINHYLTECWSSFMAAYGVIGSQWVQYKSQTITLSAPSWGVLKGGQYWFR